MKPDVANSPPHPPNSDNSQNKIIEFPHPKRAVIFEASGLESMSLTDWNEFVMNEIRQTSQPMILGLLPIGEKENRFLISAVRAEAIRRGTKQQKELLPSTWPAALCYAIAVCVAASDNGKWVWKVINERLELESGNHWNTIYAHALRKIPGVFIGEFGQKAPAINFQAGIKRCWALPLTRGIRSVSRSGMGLPHLDEAQSIKDYSEELIKACKSQHLLKSALQSPLGVEIVRRLIRNDQGDRTALAVHVQEIFDETSTDRARAKYIKKPYIQFCDRTGESILQLPKISGESANDKTLWKIGDYTCRAQFSKSIPLPNICKPNDYQLKIELIEIVGIKDKEFILQVNPSVNEPIQIFRAKDGKAIIPKQNLNLIEVCPGAYWLKLHNSVDAGSLDECFRIDDQNSDTKIWNFSSYEPISIFTAEDALSLDVSGESVTINPSESPHLKLTQRNQFLLHKDSKHKYLSYGENTPFSVYFPLTGTYSTVLRVKISSGDFYISSEEFNLCDESVSEVWDQLRDQLPIGISELTISLVGHNQKTSFYYWKGLEEIRIDFGFRVTSVQTLVDTGYRFQGFERFSHDWLRFDSDYSSTRRLIYLSSGETLSILSQGVECSLFDPANTHEYPIVEGTNIIVREDDTRLLRIQSGGFQTWQFYKNSETESWLELNRKKTECVIRLADLLESNQNHQDVLIEGEDRGTKVLLISVSRSFQLLTNPQWNREHRQWEMTIEYSDQIIALGCKYIDNLEVDSVPVQLSSLNENWGQNERMYVAEGLAISFRWVRKEGLRIYVECAPAQLKYGLNAVEFYAKDANDNWMPLQIPSGTTACLPFWGGNRRTEVWAQQLEMLSDYLCYLREHPNTYLDNRYFAENSLPYLVGNSLTLLPKVWWRIAADEICFASANPGRRKRATFLFAAFPLISALPSSQSKGIAQTPRVELSLESRCLSPHLSKDNDLDFPIWPSIDGFTQTGKHLFLLCDFLTMLSEKRDKFDNDDIFKSDVDEILSPQHFHLAISRLEARCDSHRMRPNAEGWLERDSLLCFENIWPANPKERLKVRREFKLLCAQCDIQDFRTIRGQMWFPPTRDNFSRNIATILYHFCLYARLHSHGKISEDDFDHYHYVILRGVKDRRLAEFISFGPELFAFYFALFDYALIER